MNEDRSLSDGSRLAAWSISLLGVGILLGLLLSGGVRTARGVAAERTQKEAPSDEGPFVRVAADVLPGVVSIESNRLFHHPDIPPDSSGEAPDLPFNKDGEIMVPSSGSGFIIDDQGHILTNNHVVSGASSIRVQLADGRQFRATLVGTDPQTDVAVLKIDAGRHLPVVPLGDSDALKIGEWVAAVGNPLGVLEGTLTVGVVSAKQRTEITISGSTPDYQDFIQTDAAINFGNSGGPLVNTRGEAIGMNTAFGGPGRGIGFAVSINMAKEVAKDLIADGKVDRGYMGVILQRMDGVLAEGLGLRDARGVLVREVQPGTPAEKAGIKEGDVVLACDGRDVQELNEFRLQIARTPIGRSVPLTLYRYGKTIEVRVELSRRPEAEVASAPRPESPAELGLELGPIEPGAEEGAPDSGVVVNNVKTPSEASEAGLIDGDIILEVNGAYVKDPDACRHAIEESAGKGRPAVLRVQRGPERFFVGLALDTK